MKKYLFLLLILPSVCFAQWGSDTTTNWAAINTIASAAGTNWSSLNSLLNNTGVLDAQIGNQIIQSGTANGGTVSIYTVTAGKTFYLSSYDLSNANTLGTLEVTDSGGSVQFIISQNSGATSANTSISHTLTYPIKIVSGFIIKLISGGSANCYASIMGWEK